MYAIVETCGKQYRVASGDIIKVDAVISDKEITLDKVLIIADGPRTVAGSPYIKGAAVTAEVISTGKDKKVLVYKKRPRRVYEKLNGHRQALTALKITGIKNGG